MTCIQQLRDEHSLILLMLDIINGICSHLERDEVVDSKHVECMLEFQRVFVENCHQVKEEECLFPALLESGITESGLLSALKREHEAGRTFIQGLVEGVSEYPSKSREARAKIIRFARSFRTLQVQHIGKENNILYPLADARIEKERMDLLRDEFTRIETERIGPGRCVEFKRFLTELKTVYLA